MAQSHGEWSNSADPRREGGGGRLPARAFGPVAGIACLAAALAIVASVAAAAPRHAHFGKASPPPRVSKASPPPPAPAAVTASSAPVAIGVRLVQSASSFRLTFDLSAPVAANAFVLADPNRVIVDLPEVNFQIDPQAGARTRVAAAGEPHPGLASAFRFGLFAPGKSRIVIDLAAPARIVKAASEQIARGQPSHLVVELAATDAAAFRQAAKLGAQVDSARTEHPAPPPATTAEPSARPVIVLDPGHGGIDAGASGVDGIIEKDVVFAFARQLEAKLRATGRYDVVLTRSSDVFVSLGERVLIARNAHASLFISIHADTLSDPQVSGATVYMVSDRASDAEAARIAETENMADLAGGVTSTAPVDAPQVADILFDLTRRETRTYAHVFSRTLVNYLKNVTKLNNNPVRSAGFVVLKAPDIPSVLLELGYLSSRVQAKDLKSPEWRDKAADAVSAAVDRFFASRSDGEAAARSGTDTTPTGLVDTVSRRPQGSEIAHSAALPDHNDPAVAPH